MKKERTYRFHYNCGGVVERTNDVGVCRICGKILNVHENMAKNIEERVNSLFNEYYTHHLIGGTPSTE